MRKIILAPDSFKGTMSATTICQIMEMQIHHHEPQIEVLKLPVADGGEGTVECFLEIMGGKKITMKVIGPLFEEIEAFYGILSNGTAVVEMAAAAGLPLVEGRKSPQSTTTYGVGQLIRNALEMGCKTIIIGLGGSCTNDGGAGMAAALGIRFLDLKGHEFVPVGETLTQIHKIDMSGRMKELESCTVTAICDVDNPLCGEFGAARIFGPQKGADESMIRLLDDNLLHFGNVIKEQLGLEIHTIPGGGAAGGMGAGVMALLHATLKPGIDTVLDNVDFDSMLEDADLVLTGEGRIDSQSLRGKVVRGVAGRAKKHDVPVIAIVGDIGDGIEAFYDLGVTAIVSINRVAIPFADARLRCQSDLSLTIDAVMRLMQIKSREA